jgi:fatty-acyl-CoA synthase
VTDAVAHHSRVTPDRPVIVCDDAVITYREFWDRAVRVADLLERRGVRPGDVVGVLGKNSIEWCVGAIGAMTAGAVAAGYNHRFVAAELTKLVANSQPVVVLSDDDHVERLQQVQAGGCGFDLIRLSELSALPSSEEAADRARRRSDDLASDAPALIIYTSGTTGTPKGVLHTHRTVLSTILETALLDGYIDSRRLCVLPLATAAGILSSVLHQLVRGGTIVLQEDFVAGKALDAVIKHRVTWVSGPPIVFERLAQAAGFADADLSCVRFATVGGARVPTALMQTWHQKGVVIRQLYGCTESGGFSSLASAREALERPESCGAGGVFTRIKVVDDDGRECGPGEPGEILIKGPGLTPGYYRDDAATAAAIVDGWLHTGDLGVRLPDGGLVFKDRLKEIIISGGLNISPREIEEVIAAVPGVLEVAVIPVADPKFTETPAAIVYAEPPPTLDEVLAHCGASLADFKIPRYIVFKSAPLPRLPSGKLDRTSIKRDYASLPATGERVR